MPQLDTLQKHNRSLMQCFEESHASEMATNNALVAYQKGLMEQFDVRLHLKPERDRLFQEEFNK